MLIDRIRAWNRSRRVMRMVNSQARVADSGFKFIGPDAMVNGTFEKSQTLFLSAKLKDSTAFVNIGANFGYYCCLAQKLGVRTLALEPVPVNCALLLKNIELNQYSTITVLPVAAGEQSGVAHIYGEGTGASLVEGWARNPISSRHTIPVVALDDVVVRTTLGKKPLFLMDVEGFEYQALVGAKDLISDLNYDATWIIEIELKKHRKDVNTRFLDTFKLFLDNGFRVFQVESAYSEISLEQVEKWVIDSDFDSAQGNFIFSRKGI